MSQGGDVPVVPKIERGPLGEVVRLRLDVDLLKRIDTVCAETGRTRSDVMRLLMVAGLEDHERERKRK